jgi:sporulation protein YtfJ
MNEEHPFNKIMETVLSNIKQMVDVNTIVGDGIVTPDGITIIPVSKVSFGFASGGADMAKPLTNATDKNAMLGIGNGAGVSITPIAFLVVNDGDVKLMPVTVDSNTVDKVIDAVPNFIDKVNYIIKEYKNKE